MMIYGGPLIVDCFVYLSQPPSHLIPIDFFSCWNKDALIGSFVFWGEKGMRGEGRGEPGAVPDRG